MSNLKESFEDVADWCEKHLEKQRSRKIGLTFGAILRAYGKLATLPSELQGKQRAAKEWQLNAKAEKLLCELSTRFLVAYDIYSKDVEDANGFRTNLTCEAEPQPPQ
jgi:hypothetical protein